MVGDEVESGSSGACVQLGRFAAGEEAVADAVVVFYSPRVGVEPASSYRFVQ